jgi:hypothetical protein
MGNRTLKSGSNHDDDGDKSSPFTLSHLREWWRKRGQDVPAHMMRGAAYGMGSGLVALFFLWVQNHM